MTHNTREGIEAWKDINCLEGECAECGGTGEGADNPCSDHGETYPCYVCNGTGSWSVYRKKDVDKFLHQELQKAREDERERIKRYIQKRRKEVNIFCAGTGDIFVEEIMKEIDQSELEQTNK